MGKNQAAKAKDEPGKKPEQNSEEPPREIVEAAVQTPQPQDNAEFSNQDKKDMMEFVQIAKAIGELDNADPESMTERDYDRFVERFRAWQKAGKPKPSLPKSAQAEVEKILKVYRARDRGHEYLFYVAEGKQHPVGIKKTPLYSKVTVDDVVTEDKSMQIGEEQSYEMPYDEHTARKLVDRAIHDSSSPQFYIKDGIGDSYTKAKIRNTRNFFRPFDDLMDDVRMGKKL